MTPGAAPLTAIDAAAHLPLASRQDGVYPRPQRMRRAWCDLDGVWDFRHDDADAGRRDGWSTGFDGGQPIRVPFPPESAASGIAEPGFHPVVWYARTVTAVHLRAAGRSPMAPRVLLHFGAVAYRADVWIDGRYAGGHEGGHPPFTPDVTELRQEERRVGKECVSTCRSRGWRDH